MELVYLDIIKWLGETTVHKFVSKNGVYDSYWALREDVLGCWDGVDDDRLEWYSHEEILEIYKKSKTNELSK